MIFTEEDEWMTTTHSKDGDFFVSSTKAIRIDNWWKWREWTFFKIARKMQEMHPTSLHHHSTSTVPTYPGQVGSWISGLRVAINYINLLLVPTDINHSTCSRTRKESSRIMPVCYEVGFVHNEIVVFVREECTRILFLHIICNEYQELSRPKYSLCANDVVNPVL